MVVQCAFGRLNSHGRYLQTHLDFSVINAVRIAVDCCALHNLCEARGKPFSPEWAYDTVEKLNQFTQPKDAPITARAGYTWATKSGLRSAPALWTEMAQWKRGNSTIL